MSNEHLPRISRRTLTAAGTSFAAGVLVTRGLHASAHDATPEPGAATPTTEIEPLGYVTMRMRPLDDPAFRDDMNEHVIRDYLPIIEAVDGFEGYLVGDVIDHPNLTFGVNVLEDKAAATRANEVVKEFVHRDEIDDHVVIEETRAWEGDLLMLGKTAEAAKPGITPIPGNGIGYYVAVRIHTSLPGTDPRGFVQEATDGFLPIVLALPGFVGYLWFPVEGGFVAVSMYDSEASAAASTEAAKAWATEHLAAYTDGNPEVINATVAYANMPVFE